MKKSLLILTLCSIGIVYSNNETEYGEFFNKFPYNCETSERGTSQEYPFLFYPKGIEIKGTAYKTTPPLFAEVLFEKTEDRVLTIDLDHLYCDNEQVDCQRLVAIIRDLQKSNVKVETLAAIIWAFTPTEKQTHSSYKSCPLRTGLKLEQQ